MAPDVTGRETHADGVRGALIILVVFGHFLEVFKEKSPTIATVWTTVYGFDRLRLNNHGTSIFIADRIANTPLVIAANKHGYLWMYCVFIKRLDSVHASSHFEYGRADYNAGQK